MNPSPSPNPNPNPNPNPTQGGAGLEAMQKALQKADRKHGAILHIFPLQDAHANRALRRRAKRVNPFCGQSLEGFLRDVRAQYGEKVAWLGLRLGLGLGLGLGSGSGLGLGLGLGLG